MTTSAFGVEHDSVISKRERDPSRGGKAFGNPATTGAVAGAAAATVLSRGKANKIGGKIAGGARNRAAWSANRAMNMKSPRLASARFRYAENLERAGRRIEGNDDLKENLARIAVGGTVGTAAAGVTHSRKKLTPVEKADRNYREEVTRVTRDRERAGRANRTGQAALGAATIGAAFLPGPTARKIGTKAAVKAHRAGMKTSLYGAGVNNRTVGGALMDGGDAVRRGANRVFNDPEWQDAAGRGVVAGAGLGVAGGAAGLSANRQNAANKRAKRFNATAKDNGYKQRIAVRDRRYTTKNV